MTRGPKFYSVIAIAALVAVLVVQNTEVVDIRFLFWTVSMSRVLLLPLLFIAGVLVGLVWRRSR